MGVAVLVFEAIVALADGEGVLDELVEADCRAELQRKSIVSPPLSIDVILGAQSYRVSAEPRLYKIEEEFIVAALWQADQMGPTSAIGMHPPEEVLFVVVFVGGVDDDWWPAPAVLSFHATEDGDLDGIHSRRLIKKILEMLENLPNAVDMPLEE